jgi:hypothetical protein
MRRRQFIAGLGSAVAWPAVARAQQRALPTIGFLYNGSPMRLADLLHQFRQGLSESGFVEDRNVAVEYRSAGDRYDRLPALAAEHCWRYAIKCRRRLHAEFLPFRFGL